MEFHAGGCRKPIACLIAVVVTAASLLPSVVVAADGEGEEHPEYQAITGIGDDARLSSDSFHSGGVLLGIMAFVEPGEMPVPENPLVGNDPEVEN